MKVYLAYSHMLEGDKTLIGIFSTLTKARTKILKECVQHEEDGYMENPLCPNVWSNGTDSYFIEDEIVK